MTAGIRRRLNMGARRPRSYLLAYAPPSLCGTPTMPCQDTLQLDLPRRAVGFGSGCCIESLLALLHGIIIKDGAELTLAYVRVIRCPSPFISKGREEGKKARNSFFVHAFCLSLFVCLNYPLVIGSTWHGGGRSHSPPPLSLVWPMPSIFCPPSAFFCH